jgi:zinc protease
VIHALPPAPPAAFAALAHRLAFREFDLPNGLHVILHEDHAAPLVSVSVWYHIGSRDEEIGRTGFAHLFEHMMFQGSANVPKMAHFQYVQEIGGTLNATTSFDRTNYYETVPRAHVARALWLESDRMRSLAVTAENFENQRNVVKEERRQRYENVPYGTMFETVLSKVYAASGYRWPTIGSMADLDRATVDDARAFHERYYVPNNATLAIAGDVEPAAVERLVNEYFGDIPRGVAVSHAPVAEAPIPEQVRVVTREQVPHPLVLLAFRAVPDTSEDAMPTRFLLHMLAGGNSSRLYRKLVYDMRCATSVEAHPLLLEGTGMVLITAAVAPGFTTGQVEDALWRLLREARDDSPEPHEVEKARNQMATDAVMAQATLFHRTQTLSEAWVYTGDTDRANRVWDEIEGVLAGDVLRVARATLTPDHCVVMHIESDTPPASPEH